MEVSKDKFDKAIELLKATYTFLEKYRWFGEADLVSRDCLIEDIDNFLCDYEDSTNTMFIIEDEW